MLASSFKTLLDALQATFQTTETPGKLYDLNTGYLAVPSGIDAGEPRYIVFRFSPLTKEWRSSYKSSILPAGNWKPAIGVTETDLAKITAKLDEDIENA